MAKAKAAAVGRAIRAELSKVVRDVLLLAEDNLRNSTPVDTGHASSNWVLSVGSPFRGVDGSREAVSTSAQDAGRARMMNYDVGRDGRAFLRNNVHYVQFLDRGSSPQAEPGFVAKCFLAATRRAPHGRKGSVRKMLTAMARSAYRKGV